VGEVYACNYLENVIWRVDYPLDYSLRKEGPARFQKEVQALFPKRQEVIELKARTRPDRESPVELEQSSWQWVFESLDGKKKATLTGAWLGLDCFDYVDYKSFRDLVEATLTALVKLYEPSVFTRCGLRYVNWVKLKGNPLDWDGYINPALTGQLDACGDRQLHISSHRMVLSKGDDWINLRYGVKNPDPPEPLAQRWFELDIDCYLSRDISPDEVLKRTDRLHDCVEEMFEESIDESLRTIMKKGECNDG